MSGAAGGTGFDYQADVFASVATSMLSASPLHWFDDFDDTPIAISLETDGPGDDLKIETPDGVIEIQAKHGLRGDQRYSKAVCRLFSGLLRDEKLRAVLFVDSTSSDPIKNHVRKDVQRIAGGRSDSLHPAGLKLLELLKANELHCDETVFARFRLVVRDLDEGAGDTRDCVRQLEGILPESRAALTCWDELGKEGLRLTRNRGRRDKASLFQMLRHKLDFTVSASDLIPASSYFSGFLKPGRLFHHHATLVGRKKHLAELSEFQSDSHQVGMLIGRGGIGKSKLIYEFTRLANCACWCLQSESDVSQDALRQIPKTNAIIVIEDAHRLPGLKAIIRTISSMRPGVKILLSARSHSKEHVVSTVRDAGVDVSRMLKFTEVTELTRNEVEELTAKFFPENLELAAALARTTWDCPLVTVVAAELIRNHDLPASLLFNDERFVDAVLSKLKEQLLCTSGTNVEPSLRSAILNLIAALAPVDVANQTLIEQMASHLSMSAPRLKREIGHLTESGILIRRETRLRITPDVLSDHVLHSACCDHLGTSTGYSDEVFEAFGESNASVILNNLAELDWRLQSSRVNPPNLLSDIIRKLVRRYDDSNLSTKVEILKTLTEAGYYIPRVVLPLVRTLVELCENTALSSLNRGTIEVATECLKRISFAMEMVKPSLDLLWRLRKLEITAIGTGKSPTHEVIKDIAKYDVRKPYDYAKASVEAMAEAVDIASDDNVDTAFGVIDEVLTKAPYNTYHHNHRFVTSAFVVQRGATEAPRNAALEMLFSGLRDGGLQRQLRCIKSLANALRKPLAPMGITLTQADRDQWVPEQLCIVCGLGAYLPHAEPLIVTQIVEAVGWHVLYETKEPLVRVAREVAKSVVDCFELRFLRSILRNVDGDWACDFVDAPIPVDHGSLIKGKRDSEQQFVQSVATEFVEGFSSPESGVRFLHVHLAKCQAGNVGVNMHLFLWHVADIDPDYAANLAELIIARPDRQFGLAEGIRSLTEPVARHDRLRGIQQLKLLADAGGDWRIEAATSLGYSDWLDVNRLETVEILRDLMSDTTHKAIEAVTAAIRRLSRSDQALGIRLALEYRPPAQTKVAGEYAGIFDDEYGIRFSELSADEIDQILDRLIPMPEVDHWHVEQFLDRIAKSDYARLISFFIKRIEHGQHAAGRYDPVPDRETSTFRFDTPTTEEHCRTAASLVIDRAFRADARMQRELGQLLCLLTAKDNSIAISELRSLLESGDPAKHEIAVSLVGQYGSEFVVSNSEFVCLAFEQAERLGSAVLSATDNAFYCLAVNRSRSGPAGEPFPQDVRLVEDCKKALSRHDICVSARKFYESIKSCVERDMRRELSGDEYPL